jgi:1,4-dihydroxy-2-naphthoyl-CoA synthase
MAAFAEGGRPIPPAPDRSRETTMDNPQFDQIRYDRPGVGVARITLARADIANAQDRASTASRSWG